MVYDEEQSKRSRVVVETPTARREVIRTSAARVPDRRGLSGGVVAAIVISSVALVTLLFLFILNRQNTDTAVNSNVRTETTATPLQPLVVQQPAQQQQPPIIIQQPGTTTSQPPIIIEQPAPATAPASPARSGATDDAAIQSEIDKRMSEDSALSTVAVTATVSGGKVTLIGTVDSSPIKAQVERLVRAIRGVKTVDNQVIVAGG
ncbi:MAG: hypothetical protein QOJ64_4195 [Acidobacteriota bacterium]|jgi:hypothetical protein|nr:hypothetical protein [Acidobacteriota bacterium]